MDLVNDNRTLKTCTLIQRDWCLRARSKLFHTFVIPPTCVPVAKLSPFAEFAHTLEGQTFLPLVCTLRLDGCVDLDDLIYVSGHISLCGLRRLIVLFSNVQFVQIRNIAITCCAAPTNHPCLELMKIHRIRQLELTNVTCDNLEGPICLITRLAPVDTLFLSNVDLHIFSMLGANSINVDNITMEFLDIRSPEFDRLVDGIAPTVSSFTYRSVDPRDISRISPFIVKLTPTLKCLSIEMFMYQFCEY